MGVQIRAFDEQDRLALIELWQRCDLTRAWNDPDRDIDRKLADDPELLLVADADGAIIGSIMAGYDGHRGWLNYLGVDAKYRRTGLGGALVDAGEAMLAGLGCPKINLQIRAENLGAVSFYESIGYQADAVISMGKRLTDDGT